MQKRKIYLPPLITHTVLYCPISLNVLHKIFYQSAKSPVKSCKYLASCLNLGSTLSKLLSINASGFCITINKNHTTYTKLQHQTKPYLMSCMYEFVVAIYMHTHKYNQNYNTDYKRYGREDEIVLLSCSVSG